MTYNVIQGDATNPIGNGIKVIPHVCNDKGSWGAGFVMSLSRKWAEPEKKYREWHKAYALAVPGSKSDEQLFGAKFALGGVQFVTVAGAESDATIVANMIGQHKTGYDETGRPPIRYVALADAMFLVQQFVNDKISKGYPTSIHCPMFGSALAGGHWGAIEAMILELWVDKGIDVTVYKYG